MSTEVLNSISDKFPANPYLFNLYFVPLETKVDWQSEAILKATYSRLLSQLIFFIA